VKCLLAAKAREVARKARDLVVKKSSPYISTLPGKLAFCDCKPKLVGHLCSVRLPLVSCIYRELSDMASEVMVSTK